MVKNALKILLVNLLIFFLLSCSIPPTYSRKNIDKVIKNICKKEFDIEVNAWIVGDSVWVYAPFRELVKEGEYQKKKERYQINDFEFNLTNNHLKLTMDIMVNIDKESPDSNKEGPASSEFVEKVTKDVRRIFLSLLRTFLNMENPPKFYCFIVSDTKQFGVDLYTIAFVPDMIKFNMGLISLSESNYRTVPFNILMPQALGDNEGKHIQPYDIAPNEFASLLIAKNTLKGFGDSNEEKFRYPIGIAQENANKVLGIYSLIHTITGVTIKNTFYDKTIDLTFPLRTRSSVTKYPQREVKNTLTKLYKVSFYLAQVYKYYQRKDLALAEKFSKKCLEILPDYTPALNLLGDIYNDLSEPKKALTSFNKALQENPDDATAHYGLGRTYIALGQYQQALIQLKKALELKPDYAPIFYDIGVVYNYLGEYEKALDYLQQAQEKYPDNADIYYLIGTVHSKSGNHSIALTYYQKALDINSAYVGIYNDIGLTHQALGNHVEAIANYEKEIARNPDSYQAYVNLGYIYRTLGQYEKAIANYRKALAISPKLTRVYVELGISYDALNQRQMAIAYFQKALELEPDNIQAYYFLGWTYTNLTQFQDAIDSFEKALEIDSDYAHGYVGLGNVYYHLKHYSKAREFFQKAIELFRSQNNLKEVQKTEEYLRQLPY